MLTAGHAPFPDDPDDHALNSGRLPNRVKHNDFGTFSRKMGSRITLHTPKHTFSPRGCLFSRKKKRRRQRHNDAPGFRVQITVSADKTSVVSADKTSVVSADKTSVVSADKTSVVSADKASVATADKTSVVSADISQDIPPHSAQRGGREAAAPLSTMPGGCLGRCLLTLQMPCLLTHKKCLVC